MLNNVSKKDIEIAFLELMSLFDNEGLYRHFLKSSQSPEFSHLFERTGSRSYIELYGPETIEPLLRVISAHNLLKQFVAKAKRVYKDEETGALLPPFNFWRSGWDELHLDTAEKAVLPLVLGIRTTVIDLFCLVNYGTTVHRLIQLATSGEFEATLKLIKLDPCFLTDKCTERVLRPALLIVHRKQEIITALSPDPSFWNIDSRKRMLFAARILRLLSAPGSYAAWFDFLYKHRIRHYANPKTFERACRDLGISKPYPKEREKPD